MVPFIVIMKNKIMRNEVMEMFAHVSFTDGSNPIVYRGNKNHIEYYLRKLNKRYDFVREDIDNFGNYFILVEHREDALRRILEEKLFREAKVNGNPLF